MTSFGNRCRVDAHSEENITLPEHLLVVPEVQFVKIRINQLLAIYL